MILIYNGIGIKIMSMHDYDRETVYDDSGVDALYIRHRVSVSGVYNGQVDYRGHVWGMSYGQGSVLDGRDVNQYRPPENKLPPGVVEGPSPPARTDRAILEHLMTPRRKLLLLGYGSEDITKDDVILESPLPGMGVDARNGPTPLKCSVQEQLGADATWVVNYQIETYTPVCPTMPTLLSNRFSQYHSVSQDYHLTIETAGQAVFRRDALLAQNPPLNPDTLRPFLALPVPPGFKRENIRVGHDADDMTVRYAFTDVQQPYVFVGGRQVHATRIITNFTQAISASGDKLEGILGAVERGYNLRWLRRAGQEGERVGASNPVLDAIRRHGMGRR